MDVNKAIEDAIMSVWGCESAALHNDAHRHLTRFWECACEWQKQKDAEICANEEEAMWEIFDGQPSEYHEGRADCASWLASAILNQGKDNG